MRQALYFLMSMVFCFSGLLVGTAYAGLPDLAVKDVVMTDEGKIDITIINVGDAWPAEYHTFSVGIQASKDGKGAGGWTQPWSQVTELGPHLGEFTAHFFPLTIEGTITVQVDVDQYRTIVESNEDNNRMIRTFTFGTAENEVSQDEIQPQRAASTAVARVKETRPDSLIKQMGIRKRVPIQK